MNNFIVIIIFSLTLSSDLKDETIIKDKLKNQLDCWNRGELDGFMADYWKNDQLLFIGKSGLTYGWKNTLDNYKKNYPSKAEMGTLNLELIEMKQLDKRHYFTVGKWYLKREIGDLSGHLVLSGRK